MNIIDTIRKRKSCRTFNNAALSIADKNELESYIKANANGLENEIINFSIIEKSAEDKPMKLNYGMIKGYNSYILSKSKSTIASRVNYGYLMEKVVLKATEMSIATCWIGYFDPDYFNEIPVEPGFEIPSIIIIGYAESSQSIPDKVIRFSINASKRQSWDKLFFSYVLKTPLTNDFKNKYSDSLEMVRLAPSSGNTQPWRIYYDDNTNEFHFFKKPINKNYETRGLHDIDMGIALSHFELMSIQNGLSGKWIKHNNDNITMVDDLQYIMTWQSNQLIMNSD